MSNKVEQTITMVSFPTIFPEVQELSSDKFKCFSICINNYIRNYNKLEDKERTIQLSYCMSLNDKDSPVKCIAHYVY